MTSHILSSSEEVANFVVIDDVSAIQRRCLLAAVGLSSLIMGCAVTTDDFTQCVKKPAALWVTMSVVVFFAPLTAYILTVAMQLHSTDGIALLITAFGPSDILSAVFAYYTNSDVCLCLTVFMLSTTMAVGFIPCGVLICSSAFPTLSLAEIPYDTIIIILLEGVAGLGVGMAFRKFKEHWADNFVKVFSWTPLVPVITMIVVDGILVPHSLHASLGEITAVTIYLLVVLVGTYILGLLTGQGQNKCRAMAFCAGNKSSIVVLTIIHDSYSGHILVEALPEPTFLLIVFIGLGCLLSIAYQMFNYLKNSSLINLIEKEVGAENE
ncbi:sodium-dependent organic anion transporter-like [Asterias amurensis]|uniref:sodium-dependent organic anion transporter-like n=1 Tax=Asterias amurensis TaxID=7602 RepID=UPI003AB114D4